LLPLPLMPLAQPQRPRLIAFDLETDPVASGIAASLARPGGNVSGLYFDFPEFSTKWMELLKETIPQIKSIVVVLDPASPSPQLKGIAAVAATLNVAVESMEVRTISDFDDVPSGECAEARRRADFVFTIGRHEPHSYRWPKDSLRNN
jgi:ABC-type uncharacterized transport system substrate-binding protein